jgi:tRNA G18 (ribose-2'-O)-methylase SpoU
MLPEKWLREFEPLIRSRPEEIRAYVAEKQLLEQLTGFSMYQGVLAVGTIPERATLETVLKNCGRPRLLVAVDGLSNAENLGVVVRNCGAFGVHALLVGETSSSPYLRRAVRSSMGVIFRLPIIETANLAHALRGVRGQNIRCIAADPHTNRNISRADLAADCCLVLGSEGYGICPEVLAACDEAVAIPMQNGVDSLNVGSAAAVFLYEANRQREDT